jgi:hypothetical protein
MSQSTNHSEARAAIQRVTYAAQAYGEATTAESRLADGRCIAKRDAIKRLMQTTNEETSKQHSASSAEKVVETDAEYMAYRDSERAAVVETIVARGNFHVALLTADLEVALIREGAVALAGVSNG